MSSIVHKLVMQIVAIFIISDKLFLYKSPIIEQVSIILSRNRPQDDPIPSAKIKKALLQMEYILGQAGIEALIYDLENYGVILLGKTSYTLEQLEEAFTKAVGDEAAVLLMERLQKNMQNE